MPECVPKRRGGRGRSGKLAGGARSRTPGHPCCSLDWRAAAKLISKIDRTLSLSRTLSCTSAPKAHHHLAHQPKLSRGLPAPPKRPALTTRSRRPRRPLQKRPRSRPFPPGGASSPGARSSSPRRAAKATPPHRRPGGPRGSVVRRTDFDRRSTDVLRGGAERARVVHAPPRPRARARRPRAGPPRRTRS